MDSFSNDGIVLVRVSPNERRSAVRCLIRL